MPLRIGSEQKRVLASLARNNGTWHDGCGWFYGTRSNTEKALKSLVPHGLVEQTGETPSRFAIFHLTEAGAAKARSFLKL